jgi:hypothetical protein
MAYRAIPITTDAALADANARLEGFGQPQAPDLPSAITALEALIGADCECDSTHEANDTCCCLCQYRAALDPTFKP